MGKPAEETEQEIPFASDDLVLLTSYMAEHGSSAQEVAYAVEKPHKHIDFLNLAKAEVAAGV